MLKNLRKEQKEVEEGFQEMEKELAKYGFKMSDIPSSIVIFLEDEDKGGALIQTTITEDKFKATLDKALKDVPVSFKTQKLAGKDVYVFKSEQKIDAFSPMGIPDPTKKDGVLTYVQSDVVLITDKTCFSSVINSIGKGKLDSKLTSRKSKVVKGAPFWAVFDIKQEAASPGAPAGDPMSQMGKGITGGSAYLNFQGPKQSDIFLGVCLDCIDENSAAMMQMQLQMGMSMIGMVFQENPQLGMEVQKAIKLEAKGNNLLVNISVPETLIDKIKVHVEKQQSKKKAMPRKVTAK